MRVKVILNPSSDLGRARLQEQAIVTAARPFGPVDVVMTEQRGHARDLAMQAVADGYDVVAAAGGDGTVHEVVNGLMHNGKAGARLGVIPIGTGNDFAYALNIPLQNVPAAMERLFTGAPTAVDLARVEDDRGRSDVFENNLGVGFDAKVVIETEKITRVRGFAMYLLAVFRTIAFNYERPVLRMTFDDQQVEQPVLFVAFGLGPRHGGGFLLTPDASQSDDRVDSCTVASIGRFTMLRMLTRAIKGTHVHAPFVTMRQSRCVAIDSNIPLPIHVDGEVFAYPQDRVHHVRVTSLPAALEVIV